MSRRTDRLARDVRTLEAHGTCGTTSEALKLIRRYMDLAAATPDKADQALGQAESIARRALDAIRHHRH